MAYLVDTNVLGRLANRLLGSKSMTLGLSQSAMPMQLRTY
jgi:hypothetical protein